MKKWIGLVLAALMMLSLAACASSGEEGTAATEPEQLQRPDLSAVSNWVMTAEYEGSSEKVRKYSYDNNGVLTGFGSHEATAVENELGGKTVRLISYDEKGEPSPFLSKHEYVYDAKGNLAAYRRLEPMSGDKLADSFTFEYDELGRLTKQEKSYMDLPQETITYTYDQQRLVGASYQTSVYDVTYSLSYGQQRWPDSISYTVRYVKTGNVEDCKVMLSSRVEHDQTHFRLTLVAGEGSEGVAVGKELVVYEELIDSLGDADAVRIALGDWGSFHMGWVPMRQFGALNAANWSSGSGVFVYTPLAVYLAQ